MQWAFHSLWHFGECVLVCLQSSGSQNIPKHPLPPSLPGVLALFFSCPTATHPFSSQKPPKHTAPDLLSHLLTHHSMLLLDDPHTKPLLYDSSIRLVGKSWFSKGLIRESPRCKTDFRCDCQWFPNTMQQFHNFSMTRRWNVRRDGMYRLTYLLLTLRERDIPLTDIHFRTKYSLGCEKWNWRLMGTNGSGEKS